MAAERSTALKEAQVGTETLDDFSTLLKQSFKPRTDRAASEVENAVTTLVKEALADSSVVKDDVLDTIESMIAKLDEKLTVQVNEIIHSPEFQKMESAWRGLHYLVFNSETDAQLKIKVMNVSKTEIYKNLRLYPGARWDQSPAVQAHLRTRIRAAWWPALRRDRLRLRIHASGSRRTADARSLESRGRGACAAVRRRESQSDGHGFRGTSS